MVTESEKQQILNFAVMVGLHDLCEPKVENQILPEEDLLSLIITLLEKRYSGPRSRTPKSSDFLKNILFNLEYDDSRFRQHLRMNRKSFFQLLEEIKGDPVFTDQQTEVYVQLAIGLTELGSYGNGASLRIVAAKFGKSEGSVNNYTCRLITALTNLSQKWIKWPDFAERQYLGYQMGLQLLPKCIGFVDGSDATFYHAPSKEKETYWSRKKKYCMQFQIVCDQNKVIRHFTTGYPGSVHDAKVYNSCPLFRKTQDFFSSDEFIIGDSAYAKSDTVVVPYKRTHGHLDHSKSVFNRHLASKRVYVEHTIGILKGGFQSLLNLRINVDLEKGHQKVCYWIQACVILHNFLMEKDPWNLPNDFVFMDPEENEPEFNEMDIMPNARAELKRSALCTIVNSMIVT